jgi:hypothetical protein
MNYLSSSPAKMLEPLEQNLMNEVYPGAQHEIKEEQFGLHSQMNAMTAMKDDFLKEEQH